MTDINIHGLIAIGLLVLVGVAAIDALGWLHGAGVTGAVWLLMPYGVRQ